MKKEEYLSLIDEVIAQGPYTDTWDSLCEHPTPKWYARKTRYFYTLGCLQCSGFRKRMVSQKYVCERL